MDATAKLNRFRINQRFRLEQESKFLKDLFESDQVIGALCLKQKGGKDITNIQYERLETSVLSMDFFDRFKTAGIVTPSGHLRRCMDEIYHNKQVSDLLGDFLLNDESESADLFTEKEKSEFIFQLVKFCVVGGAMCQPSDMASDYFDTVKQIYKTLVTVHRSAKSQQIEVSSYVYKVESIDGQIALFPSDSPFNSCYVIVDAKTRLATTLYCPYVPFW